MKMIIQVIMISSAISCIKGNGFSMSISRYSAKRNQFIDFIRSLRIEKIPKDDSVELEGLIGDAGGATG